MHGELRIGVIGAGRIGALHSELLRTRVGGARVVAVTDIDEAAARRVAEAAGIQHVEPDAERLIERDDIDAVLVCSATHVHEQQVCLAAKHGKHVFCEKPLSFELAAIERMQEAVEEAGVVLQVGFNRRFDAAFARVKAGIEQGEIGRLQTLRVISRDPEPPPVEYVRNSGGLFVDMTIHDFDMVRFLSGAEISEVYVMADCFADPRIKEVGDVDTAVILMRLSNGVVATIENSRKAVYGYDQRVEAFGSEGSILTDNVYPNPAKVLTATEVRRDLPLRFFLERYTESYVNELDAFVSTIRTGGRSPVDVNDGRAPVVLGEAAGRSHRERRPVSVQEVIERR